MSWAKWDAEHRGANVRVTPSATGGSKVTSGGKHLGNIERRGDKHVAVVKAGPGRLASKEFDTHEDALNHIRQAHGLSRMTSAQKMASRVETPKIPATEVKANPHDNGYMLARTAAREASDKASNNPSAESHLAAAASHLQARELAPDNLKSQHESVAKYHQTQAKKIQKPKAPTAKKTAAPAPRAAKTALSQSDHHPELVEQARQLKQIVDQHINLPGKSHQTAVAQATQKLNKLWPKMSHRDVAESVVGDVHPGTRQSMVDEVARHVAFTNKSSVWKRTTVDVSSGLPGHVRGKTIGFNVHHVVLNHNMFHPSTSQTKAAGKRADFRSGFHSTDAFGPDDVGGHRATLAHELGHALHNTVGMHQEFGSTEHVSKYGNKDNMERAAEAYAAAFARAHGHSYQNEHEANVGLELLNRVHSHFKEG